MANASSLKGLMTFLRREEWREAFAENQHAHVFGACQNAGVGTGEIPGTGKLDRILFNEQMEELRRESLLVDLRQRVRDVQQGPDGLLYVITDEDEGAVLRIEPR